MKMDGERKEMKRKMKGDEEEDEDEEDVEDEDEENEEGKLKWKSRSQLAMKGDKKVTLKEMRMMNESSYIVFGVLSSYYYFPK
ncbi:hypothetical protein JCGZ_01476 [Jatropha curcas]|uniref:Uncharacterized protein n=1 Tax=Jatropha curcas TaxID=180498 RepID=A0A067L936_JATCU|nr:hypothetical protein JCGZ_01476 [Jatropha curcas]